MAAIRLAPPSWSSRERPFSRAWRRRASVRLSSRVSREASRQRCAANQTITRTRAGTAAIASPNSIRW